MLSEIAVKRLQWIAPLIGFLFLSGGLVLNFSNQHIDTSNLILIGIGVVIAAIPWIQSFHLGVDGIQLTTIKSSSAVIADNLQKTVDETKNAMESLQSQIDRIKEELAAQTGSKTVASTTEEKKAVSEANDLYGVVSSAMSGITTLLKTF
jgi:hypothetical protein